MNFPKQTDTDKYGRVPVYDVASGKVIRRAPVDAKEACKRGLAQPVAPDGKQEPVVEVKHKDLGTAKVNECDKVLWEDRGYEVVGKPETPEVETDSKPAPEPEAKPKPGPEPGSLQALRDEFEEVVGRKPHPATKPETLREQIDEAKGQE